MNEIINSISSIDLINSDQLANAYERSRVNDLKDAKRVLAYMMTQGQIPPSKANIVRKLTRSLDMGPVTIGSNEQLLIDDLSREISNSDGEVPPVKHSLSTDNISLRSRANLGSRRVTKGGKSHTKQKTTHKLHRKKSKHNIDNYDNVTDNTNNTTNTNNSDSSDHDSSDNDTDDTNDTNITDDTDITDDTNPANNNNTAVTDISVADNVGSGEIVGSSEIIGSSEIVSAENIADLREFIDHAVDLNNFDEEAIIDRLEDSADDDFDRIITPEGYKILQILRKYRRTKRLKQQENLRKLTEDSNRRISEILLKNMETVLEDGVDVYAYFNYHTRAVDVQGDFKITKRHKIKKLCFKIPNTMYKYGVAVIVISIQLFIPVMLLITQLFASGSFTPVANNLWFRITGFLTMSHSTAVLRKQIINQVSWAIIDNNRIMNRIQQNVQKPKTRCLFIGLYINMFMSIIVVTNIYIMYCQSTAIIDLLLNMLALNFLLDIDNDAFKMMVGNDRITDIIKSDMTNQVLTMVERANYNQVRIIKKMKISPEYIVFYIVALYSIALPFLFLFYNIIHVELGRPCLGLDAENITRC